MSTTTTLTIADFLLARVAEDEAAAQAATGADRTGTWWVEPDEGGVSDVSCLDVQGFITAVDVDAAHLVRHDPARVLAECAAKRATIAWCGERHRIPVARMLDGDVRRESDLAVGDYANPADSVVLRHMASMYADHPEYDEAWRP